jgi:glucose-1-phosphate cytidylyltransferase
VKVVLFCGGLGTRIRDHAENVPKPMIPVGQQPIMLHVMQYYAHYGHRDFVLCLGYKANTIKDFFLGYRPTASHDFIVSEWGQKVEILGQQEPDWRVTLIDTGIWRNVGARLFAVRDQLRHEPMFCANYSDGLTDARLPDMVEFFEASGKIGCFLAVQPNFSYHLVDFDAAGVVRGFSSAHQSEVWINGGFFIFRPEIFDYMRDGEELVVEPFRRLIEAGELVAYKHRGFWASMDTLKDKQLLEDMVERGETPWLPWQARREPRR